MPLPLFAIPLIAGGVKALIGAFAPKPKRPTVEVPAEVKEATNLARRQATQTVAPGYSTHLETLRKMGTDAMAQARRTIKDPSQLQSMVSQITNMMNKGASDLKGMNERHSVRMLTNLQTQLGSLSKHKVRVQDIKDQRKMQEEAARSNLFGSAFQDVNTAVNIAQMGKEMEAFQENLNTIYGSKKAV